MSTNKLHVIVCNTTNKKTSLKKKKPKNIFFLYRDEMMPFRPYGMPMCDYNRIIRDKWIELSDEEKNRYRLIYEINRDVTEDIEQTSSQTKEAQNSCAACTACGISIENSEICNTCVEQLYQIDSMYSYDHCKLCSSFSGNSRICIVCYEQNTHRYNTFFDNGEIPKDYGPNYDTNYPSEGILGLADRDYIDYDNYITFEEV
ncbi:hypothetical protein C1646_662121 [Rhizophagus diaphanus]|nr:hypothetical protein C1646_662121 [Rhizophagus diaphanus] [Rhizophagus sp. MUCL 43196]